MPACVDPTCNESVHVLAMLKGKTGRDVWLDIESFEWVMSYAADQLARRGITCRHVEENTIPRMPNLDGFEGVWKAWCPRFKRYSFVFVQDVPGLPDGNLNVRRYLLLAGITDMLWDKFGIGDLATATVADKKVALLKCIKEWCSAIVKDDEKSFLDEHHLPPWRVEVTTATAATAEPTTSSNLDDDWLQDDGVGIKCGTCASESDDVEMGTSCDEESSAAHMADN